MQSSDTSKLDVYAMKNKHSRGYKPICVTFTILLFMPQYFAQRNGQKVEQFFFYARIKYNGNLSRISMNFDFDTTKRQMSIPGIKIFVLWNNVAAALE